MLDARLTSEHDGLPNIAMHSSQVEQEQLLIIVNVLVSESAVSFAV